MGKFKKILSTFVLLLSMFTLTTIKTEAATNSISITSNKSEIVVGNTITFTVNVTAAKPLIALQYDISYDKSMMTLTSGSTSDIIDYNKGTSTQKLTFKFKAKKSGTAKLTFNANGVPYDLSKEITFASKTKSVKVITQAQLEASYSKNNNLSSLGVTGYTLSPKFSSSVTSYTVNLPANTEKITITGKKSDSKASIEGLGTKTVVDGTNTIKVKVTAENGSTKTYTINAIVQELNPINVTVNDIEYTVIRKAKLLESPNSNFIESTTIINEEEVPSLFNEKANMTLVGLKDNEGNIELYIYNQKDNTYTKYNQHSFSNLTLYLEDKEIENYISKEELTIDEKTINVYTIKKDSSYYYFYAINLENGIESIYRYEKDENTVQKYIEEKEEEKIIITNPTPTNEDVVNEEIYKYIILGLLGFIFLTYIIILFNLIFGKNKTKSKKDVKIADKEEIAVPITEETTKNEVKEEVPEEKKEKKSKKKKEKITEEEKEKLQKESEEELNRIKEENSNNEEISIVEENTKSKRKSKKKNKKD